MFNFVFFCNMILTVMIFHKLFTLEPLIYDHPMVPHILFVHDRWS